MAHVTWWRLVGVLVLGACSTVRNPAFCGDGLCTDPSLPFCDVDGSFGANPGTCIAVSCEPRSFAGCRDDRAITCNDAGDNFDLVQCELGCSDAAMGCRVCTTNAQCTATEVCDTTSGVCRGCKADDECDSRVCDLTTSMCVAEANVVYAAPQIPDGSGAPCRQQQPCSFGDAAGSAFRVLPPLTVRMLPGMYGSPLKLVGLVNQPLPVVATGVDLEVVGEASIVADRGGKLDIRGIRSSSSTIQVKCGSTNAMRSSISIHNAELVRGDLFDIEQCTLALDDVRVTDAAGTWVARTGSSLRADRLAHRIPPLSTANLTLIGTQISVRFQNSVLENLDFSQSVFAGGSGDPGSELIFANVTRTFGGDTGERFCSKAPVPNLVVRFENSILRLEDAGADTVPSPTAGTCSFVSTLLSSQASPPAGTLVGDPQFVNPTAHDYHLKATSPAIDKATPGMLTTDHDLDGVSRPQGAAPDLGAFELH